VRLAKRQKILKPFEIHAGLLRFMLSLGASGGKHR
jgi:hypothetical protein